MAESDYTWIDIEKGASVLDAEGEVIGHVLSVEGEVDGDLFHSIAIRHHLLGHELTVPADAVVAIAPHEVRTSLTAEQARHLEHYHPIHGVHGGHERFHALSPEDDEAADTP